MAVVVRPGRSTVGLVGRTIHVATVHWRDDRWVDVQLSYLRRFVSSPLRVYAFLNRLPADHSAKFFYSSTEDIESHRMKLNLLADVIRFAAEDPDDILVFIDGDAIPIVPLDPFLNEHLRRHDLIAVQRLENEDPLPHPSFCATRVGFWHEIGGDWYKDYAKQSRTSRADPDGGNLLRVLRERQADWHPLLRSNRRDLHPLFFGVYGDLVYHHGGGFRPSAGGRAAISQAVEKATEGDLVARGIDALPRSRLRRALRRRFHPAGRIKRELQTEVQKVSEEMFERIKNDPHFYRDLLGGEEPRSDAPPKASSSGVLERYDGTA